MNESTQYLPPEAVLGLLKTKAGGELEKADLTPELAGVVLEKHKVNVGNLRMLNDELQVRAKTPDYETNPDNIDRMQSSLTKFLNGELPLDKIAPIDPDTGKPKLDQVVDVIQALKLGLSILTGGRAGGAEEGEATGVAGDMGHAKAAADFAEPDATTTQTPPAGSVFDGDKPDEGDQTATDAPVTINILGGEATNDDPDVKLLDDPDGAQADPIDPNVANQIQVGATDDSSTDTDAGDAGASRGREEEVVDTGALVISREDIDPASEAGDGDGDVPAVDAETMDDTVSASADSAGSGGGGDGGEPPAPPEPPTVPEPLEPGDKEKITALLSQIVTRDLSTHYYPGNIDGADDYEQSAAYLAFRDEVKQAWQAQADELGLDPDGWDTVSAKALNYWKNISENPKSGKPGEAGYLEEGLSYLWITIEENLGEKISTEDKNALAKETIEVMATQINENRVHAIRDFKDGTNYFFQGNDIDIDAIESGVNQIRAEKAEQQAKEAAAKAKEQADREKSFNSLIEKYTKKGEVPDEVFKKSLETLLEQALVDLPSNHASFKSHAKTEDYAKRHAKITNALAALATENGWTGEGDYELVATNILNTWFYAGLAKNEDRRMHPDQMTDSLVNLYESIQSQIPVNEPDLLARATVGELVEKLNREKDARQFTGKIDFENIESAVVQSRIDKQFVDEERIRAETEIIQARLKEQFSREINNLAEKFQVLGPQRLKAIRNKIALNTALPEDQQTELQTLLNSELKTVFGDDETKWPISPYGKDKFNQGYWFEVMRRAHEAVEYPQARIELRQRLVHQLLEAARVGKESGVGNESVRQFMEDLIAPVKDSYWRGKWTPELRKVVPQELSLMEYSEELEALAEVVGVDTEPGRETKNKRLAARIKKTFGLEASNGTTIGGLLADAEKQQQMVDILAEVVEENAQDRMYGQMYKERGFAEYMFLPQNQEIILKAHKLTDKEREQWLAYNYYIMLRSGQNSGMARFNGQAMQGDKRSPASETGMGTAARFVHQVMEASGNVGHEERQKMIGYHAPERVFYMAELDREISVRVMEKGEMKEIDFTLSTMDVLGTFCHREAMAELRANMGYGQDSATDAEGKWMKYTMYRKMGYADKDVRRWLKQDKQYRALLKQGEVGAAETLRASWNGDELPEVVWSSDISLSDLTDCNSADDLMGNNWGMVMFANAMIDAYRIDLRILPTDDTTRRHSLRLRGDQADYSRKYAKDLVPGQTMAVIALHPDLPSISMEYTLIRPLKEMAKADLNLSQEGALEILAKRLEIIDRVAKYQQISPAGAKTLGLMTLGQGPFRPTGATSAIRFENYKKQLAKFLPVTESLNIPTYRDFEDWHTVAFSDVEIEAAWSNHDFRPELNAAGMTDREIERYGYDTRGVKGWQLFVRNANFSLFQNRDNTPYKDPNSTFNYPLAAANAASTFLQTLDLKHPAPDMAEGTFHLPVSLMIAGDYPNQKYTVTSREIDSREDRLAEENLALVGFKQTYGNYTQALEKAWAEINFKGFANADAYHAMHMAALAITADANLAYSLDWPVYDIDLSSLGEDGGAFSIARISKGEWKRTMGFYLEPTELEKAEEFLRSQGFRFVRTPEMKNDDSAIMVGPNTAYVPKVTSGGELLESIIEHIGQRIGASDLVAVETAALLRLAKRAQNMLDKEYFCWQTLVDNASNMFVMDMNGLADSLTVGTRVPNQLSENFESALWRLVSDGHVKDKVLAGAYVYHKSLEKGISGAMAQMAGRGRGMDVEVEKDSLNWREKIGRLRTKPLF